MWGLVQSLAPPILVVEARGQAPRRAERAHVLVLRVQGASGQMWKEELW